MLEVIKNEKLMIYLSIYLSIYLGLSVLEVIKNEKLMSSAQMVGKYLKEELIKLKERSDNMSGIYLLC